MHWKDALIKHIEWLPPTLKQIEDGKLDFNVHIPLTKLFQEQTKLAFTYGIVDGLNFAIDAQVNKTPITKKALNAKLKEWGITLPKPTKEVENAG